MNVEFTQTNGQPGYLRVDSVHQGDLDKRKGLYHINVVDEVTQYEIVITVERISERYLIPALEDLLDQFPFKLLGFHSDNGSEYINKRVAEYEFNRLHLNPHLNFHRPCLFALTVTDSRGREKKTYPYERMNTPYEKFKSLPKAAEFLKSGMSFEILDAIAYSISDNESAAQLNAAYRKLNQHIHESDRRRA